MVVTVTFFVILLTVVMSLDWSSGGFRPSAPTTILFGGLVAALVLIASTFSRRDPAYFFPSRTCPFCRRIIPADSNLCPYCGSRLQ